MGFFSSIVRFVKSVVKSIVNFVARIFQGVFGSPIVAALAIFVVAFILEGPAAFALLAESPWLFLTQYPVLSALALNVVTQVATLICPQIGRVLGLVSGLLTFVTVGLNVYSLFANGTWMGTQGIIAFFGMAYDLDMVVLEAFFTFMTAYSVSSLVSGLSSGPNSAYVNGLVDGIFVIPEAAAAIADATVSAAVSAVGGLLSSVGFPLLLLAGGYFLLRGSQATRLVVEDQHHADTM